MAGNNFIFCAYIHCKLPAVNRIAADPTGKSFILSLVNASGKAVRFSLRDKDRAIRVAGGISFGADKYEDGQATGYPNFTLMLNGAADQKDANAANNCEHRDTPYEPDDGRAHDATFLAGQRHFAAAEIEVFQL